MTVPDDVRPAPDADNGGQNEGTLSAAPAEPAPDIAASPLVDALQHTEAPGPLSEDQFAEATAEPGSGQDDEPPAAESVPDPDPGPVSALAEVVATMRSLGGKVDDLTAATAEVARLRTRDTDLIARLHEDVTKLRT